MTEAARMAEDGLTLEEAAKRIETLKMTSRIFFTTADLSYLQKGGRVGKAMIQVASMLKIKPMIQLYEGELQAAGIVRSRKKSLQRFIDDTKRFFKDKNINDYRICTGYGYDKEEFNALYAEVVKENAAAWLSGRGGAVSHRLHDWRAYRAYPHRYCCHQKI